ncbi:MAG: dihydroneopterin aldolase [bacterium]
MFKVKINDIRLQIYAGIAKEERSKKNRILINIEYLEEKKNIIDYSTVYEITVKTALSKRWDLLEDLVCEIYKEIKKRHKKIISLKVSAKKLNPVKMEKSLSAEVSYGAE